MLSARDNERLTAVGPGTPMGKMMREYWIPVLMSSEVKDHTSDPVRVMVLGETFVAYRDHEGRIGLIQENCPHRGASLFFARNEPGGLRCLYHGWKFSIDGKCVDMPNEPAESDFKQRIQARAPKTIERGGLVWAYLGTREDPPEMPGFDYLEASPQSQRIYPNMLECNWLQTLEGDLDTGHFGFLHVGHLTPQDVEEDSFVRYIIEDRSPRFKTIDTPNGVSYGAYRSAGDTGDLYWRVAHFMFPFYSMVPVGLLGASSSFVARVPIDDHHTMTWFATANATGLISDSRYLDGLKTMANTSSPYGRFRSAKNVANDYEIDRATVRDGTSFTGLGSVALEDRVMNETMGSISDRTREHLGSSDIMVIRTRRRMLRALQEYEEKGTLPPGLSEPESYRQKSGGVVLPADADWWTATADLRSGKEKPSLDAKRSVGV